MKYENIKEEVNRKYGKSWVSDMAKSKYLSDLIGEDNTSDVHYVCARGNDIATKMDIVKSLSDIEILNSLYGAYDLQCYKPFESLNLFVVTASLRTGLGCMSILGYTNAMLE